MLEALQKHSPKRRNLVLAQNPTAELHPTAILSRPIWRMTRPLATLVESSSENKFMQISKLRYVESNIDILLRPALNHATMSAL